MWRAVFSGFEKKRKRPRTAGFDGISMEKMEVMEKKRNRERVEPRQIKIEGSLLKRKAMSDV